LVYSLMVWIKFILCASLVIIIGSRLSLYGDIVAERTGLGRLWVGAVVVGVITSLPELVTALSAVIFLKRPNLAAGGLFGSCLFNMAIITFSDLIYKEGPLLSHVRPQQIVSAGVSILLVGIAACGLLIGRWTPQVSLFGVQLPGLLILFVYLLGLRLMFIHRAETAHETLLYKDVSHGRAWGMFSLLSFSIVILGVWLAYIGEDIALVTGWKESFVGVLFLAVVTSLPEMVVSIGALRIGAVDLSIGNLFGSNCFNIFILFFCDFFFKGNFWGSLSPLNALAAAGTIVMSALAITGIVRKKERAKFIIEWESFLIIVVYLTTSWILFTLR